MQTERMLWIQYSQVWHLMASIVSIETKSVCSWFERIGHHWQVCVRSRNHANSSVDVADYGILELLKVIHSIKKLNLIMCTVVTQGDDEKKITI